MAVNKPYGTQEWVDLISVNEMPALTSTVRRLEALSHDKTSTLASLGQSILHDHGLTSKVLRVVNANRKQHTKVTTVSRAAVILGVEAIKNICITAKLLSSLLKNKDLSNSVYQRLLKLLAQSFHCAMLAKMMAYQYDDDTQEKIFVASLLHHIGETAFWSLGGETSAKLDAQLNKDPEKRQQLVTQALGTSFERISVGLASSWNFSDFLVKSLDDPEARTKEMQIIVMADRLSQTIIDPVNSGYRMSNLMLGVSELMNISGLKAKNKISQCSTDTVKQLRNYGASALTAFIKSDLKDAISFEEINDYDEPVDRASLQLDILREMVLLSRIKADFNQIFHLTLEGITRGIGFETAVVILFDADKRRLIPRFIVTKDHNTVKSNFTIDTSASDNLFSQAIKDKKPFCFAAEHKDKLARLLTPQIKKAVCARGFCIAPVIIGERCIGLVYGDFSERNLAVSAEEFNSFNHFVMQANMNLSIVTRL